jgi:hypothetical protein
MGEFAHLVKILYSRQNRIFVVHLLCSPYSTGFPLFRIDPHGARAHRASVARERAQVNDMGQKHGPGSSNAI